MPGVCFASHFALHELLRCVFFSRAACRARSSSIRRNRSLSSLFSCVIVDTSDCDANVVSLSEAESAEIRNGNRFRLCCPLASNWLLVSDLEPTLLKSELPFFLLDGVYVGTFCPTPAVIGEITFEASIASAPVGGSLPAEFISPLCIIFRRWRT